MCCLNLNTFKCSFSGVFSQLRNKLSGCSADFTVHKKPIESNNIFLHCNTVICNCGWKGKNSESIKSYHLLNDDLIEMELHCARCKKYLGFTLFKDVA
jgi:hypothetical protein